MPLEPGIKGGGLESKLPLLSPTALPVPEPNGPALEQESTLMHLYNSVPSSPHTCREDLDGKNRKEGRGINISQTYFRKHD